MSTDSLRFKVCVSSGDPEFYQHLKMFGPYYRSRRLLELARFGFSVQKGLAMSSSHQAPAVTAPPEVSSGHKLTHYKISEDAATQISEMLDSIEDWGTA